MTEAKTVLGSVPSWATLGCGYGTGGYGYGYGGGQAEPGCLT